MDPEQSQSGASSPASNSGNQDLPSNLMALIQESRTFAATINLLTIQLIVGPICFYFLRHQISGKKTDGFLDAFYFNMVLMSSTGYGDFTPDTTLSVLLASLFAILGKVLVGLLMSVGLDALDTRIDREDYMKNMYAMLISYLMFMVPGTLVLFLHEKLDFIHAFYCIITTITGVGSSRCFSTKGGRGYAIIWMLYGTIYLCGMLLLFGHLYAERRQESSRKRVREREMTSADFHKADLDNDGVLSISEYALYKLHEMGKFKLEDITHFVEDFQKRNVDNKDGLTLKEINDPRDIPQTIIITQNTSM